MVDLKPFPINPYNIYETGTYEWVKFEIKALQENVLFLEGRHNIESIEKSQRLQSRIDELMATPHGPKAEAEIQEDRRKERISRAWDRAKECGLPQRYIGKGFNEFESPTKEHRRAKEAVERMASDLSGSAMILLFGPPGTGKTHLAAAAMHQRTVLDPSAKAEYITASGIAQEVRESYDEESVATERGIIDRLVRRGFLVIDEIGAGLGSDHERAMLNSVVCGRYNALLPTLLVSNLGLEALKASVGDRVMDRLKEDAGSAVIPMAWTSWRGRRNS